MIRAKSLSKKYGAKQALVDVNLDIGPGEIVALVGPNGAGKTTLLRSLIGLCRYEGELTVLGRNPMRQRAAILRETSVMADTAVLPPWMTAEKLIAHLAGIHPGFNQEKAEALLAETDVPPDSLVAKLSKGMVAQLHLSLLMSIESKLMILDEPTLGLDVLFRTEFYKTLIEDYHNSERSIIISTHHVEEIEDIVSHAIFIDHGKILLNQPINEIASLQDGSHKDLVELFVATVRPEQQMGNQP